MGHELSGTVLTLLQNLRSATQRGCACSSIPTMAAGSLPGAHVPDFAKFVSQRPLMARLSSFFVQKLMLGGVGLAQTTRSTPAPTMGVTERKK